MSNQQPVPALPPRRSPRRRLATALVAVVVLVVTGGAALATATAPQALAACPPFKPTCQPDPGDPFPPPKNDYLTFVSSLTHLRAAEGGNQRVAAADMDVTQESPTSPVTLDACDSTAGGGTSFPGIARYVWTFGNGQPPQVSTTCRTSWNRPVSATPATVPVSLSVVAQRGATLGPLTQSIRYRDVVIASVGDSAASGQGAPDSANDNPHPFSISKQCYRSGWAASAQSALRAQTSLGNDVTVHFWFLACSGARITSSGAGPWMTHSGKGSRAVDWGGMLTPFSNSDNSLPSGAALPPQVDRLQTLENQSGLQIDSLLLTIGANDTNWSEVLATCMWGAIVPLPAIEDACLAGYQGKVKQAVDSLPAHFRQLADRLNQVVPPGRVYVTDYFDPLDSLRPMSVLCPGEVAAFPSLRAWAITHVENPLQAAVSGGAAYGGWHYINQFRQLTQGHGVCNGTGQPNGRWVNSISDSLGGQKSTQGVWHANFTGQQRMTNIEAPILLSSLRASEPRRSTLNLLTRNTDGSWAGSISAQLAADVPGQVTAVASTAVGDGETQYLMATNDGRLWHTRRFADGTWQPAGRLTGFTGRPTALAATSTSPHVAQFLVVTADAHVWHTVRFADNTWQSFGDVRNVTHFTGTPVAVAATSPASGEAQFLIATSQGSVFHTIRYPDGSWQQANDLHSAAGLTGAAVALAATSPAPGVAQFFIATTNGQLWQTARYSQDGSWQTTPVEVHTATGFTGRPVAIAATAPDAGTTQVLITTSDGRLSHTVRSGDLHGSGTWQPAGDAGAAVSLTGAVHLAAATSPTTQVAFFLTVA